jgi:hypothetical protein
LNRRHVRALIVGALAEANRPLRSRGAPRVEKQLRGGGDCKQTIAHRAR